MDSTIVIGTIVFAVLWIIVSIVIIVCKPLPIPSVHLIPFEFVIAFQDFSV